MALPVADPLKLPSPEELKGKILLKGKTIKYKGAEDLGRDDEENSKENSNKNLEDFKVAKELSDITFLSSIGFKDFERALTDPGKKKKKNFSHFYF